MAKVAIITRTKDRPAFLKRAIKSAADQNYNDYVQVIVNDGGVRGQVEDVLASFDGRIRGKIELFHREEPSGAPDTIFTESIDRVDSEYFAIHDDDDTWHPDFLAKTVQHLDKHPDVGAVVVRTDKVIEEVDGVTITEEKRAPWMPDIKVVNLYRQCIDNQMTPISTLYRRSAYTDVGKFDDTLPVIGDWEFGLRLLQKYDVDFIDPGFALANYHHRTDGVNSFSQHNHRVVLNKVMNSYLRQELAEGRLGVGYIMNKLRYDQHEKAEMVRRVLPSFVVNRMKKKIQN